LTLAHPQNERAEAERSFATSERMAATYMHLANETVNMVRTAPDSDTRRRGLTACACALGAAPAQIKYMTTEMKEPFLRPEIIDRLTGMLTYNLAQLVGPKCTELKVRPRHC
jgi:ubiquitin conjugation factor E4 B